MRAACGESGRETGCIAKGGEMTDQPAIDSLIESLTTIEEQLGTINDDRAQPASVYVDAAVRLLRRGVDGSGESVAQLPYVP